MNAGFAFASGFNSGFDPAFNALPYPLGQALLCGAAVAADRLFSEPRRWHPLAGFGRIAGNLERHLNPVGWRHELNALPDLTNTNRIGYRAAGLIGWCLMVLPIVVLAVVLMRLLPLWAACLLHVTLLWFALGARSLQQHLEPIAAALANADLSQARQLTARIVSRDTATADGTALARAAVESALENGNDAVFGAVFWFIVAGGPGALAFRLINTLDAMWGYRTPRLIGFGWAAARIDDLANYLPARLTAASYALLGNTAAAWRCWRLQAPAWDSPNAGPVMAAGAGSLGLELGGAATYHGVREARPVLGTGRAPQAQDILKALVLVRRTLRLWLAALLVLGLMHWSMAHWSMMHSGIATLFVWGSPHG